MLGCAQQGGLECQERLSQIIHFPIMLGCMSPIIDNIAWEESIHQQKYMGILLISPNSQSKRGSFRLEGMRLNKANKCMVEGSEAGRVIWCQRKKSSSKMISWEQKHIVLTSCGNGAPWHVATAWILYIQYNTLSWELFPCCRGKSKVVAGWLFIGCACVGGCDREKKRETETQRERISGWFV